MTEPGYVAPPSPGWWVRTGRVGVNATGYNWAVTATGTRAAQGAAAGAYTWAGAAVGVSPVLLTFIGANINAGNNVTIPTHAVGDLIVLCGYKNGANNLVISKPSASGTVPAWVDIDAAAGANNNVMTTVQFVATATTTTTGSWTGATHMIAAVIRNPFATPIGGHAESGSTSATAAAAPSVTLAQSDNSSMLLHFFGHKTASAWAAAPTGYTQRAALASTDGACLITKNVVTSSAGVSQPLTGTNVGYRGATVEVRAH